MNDCGRRRSAGFNRIRLALRLLTLAFPLLLLVHRAAAAEIFEEIIEQRHAVDSDSTLSIHNTDGAIRVYAGDGSAISIQAIKRAYTSDRLKSIVVDVKATRKSIAIETIAPPPKSGLSLSDRSGTVEYIVTVPHTMRITNLDLVNGELLVEGLRGGSATAHLVNGWLLARNCFGDLDFAITNGRLDVAYDWWENTKFSVKLSSSHGSIRALIPSDASAGITARSGTGRIVNAFEMKKEIPSERAHALNFATGPKPEAVFEVNSTSGDIRIEKTY
jgi:hypothetical protein